MRLNYEQPPLPMYEGEINGSYLIEFILHQSETKNAEEY
jgi:hypothetical protein